jgi:hypothetical protein
MLSLGVVWRLQVKSIEIFIVRIPLELPPVLSGNVSVRLSGGTMTVVSIADRLFSLPNAQKTALAEIWRHLFKTDPPDGLRKELMVQFLAYRMQEEEFGGLTNRSHSQLRELAKALNSNSNKSVSNGNSVKPGTRLIRQWKDQVHVVNVEEGRYEYRGSRYQSLSEIARLITGTRWSGPLFFGLNDKRTTTKST